MQTPVEVLEHYWGYDQFRPLQEDIIDSVLQGKDSLALLPTGGGKSICFQVPALLMQGTCIVISPLIALMKDQVENLLKRGIPATYLHSGMKRKELYAEMENMLNGRYKLVYLSPERIRSDEFRSYLSETGISFIAVDEAHCVSQWGYDFRPEYLNIKQIREILPDLPMLALTASATPRVMDDLCRELELKDPEIFRKSFDRPNLNYVVLHDENKHERILRILDRIKGSGIIYTRNRKSTEELAVFLQRSKVSADFYHAGIPFTDRMRKQEAWTAGRTRIMTCTNAFGMGIDKADVRLVIHFEAPDSIESYYQEAGRAGRDDHGSWCVLMNAPGDKEEALRRFELQYPAEPVISRIYDALCDYHQVAFHSGMGAIYNLNLEDFTDKFGLKMSTTLNALRLLEQMGYIKVSDGVYIPARLKFMVTRTELYEFQIRNSKIDPLIKVILRNYGGVFSFYTIIRIQELAEKLRIPRAQVELQLQFLDSREIIHYVPARDQPFVSFLQPRVRQLDFRAGYIAQSKKRTRERLDTMFGYIEQDRCRSRIIREYFGEKVERDCGKCDVCRKREQEKRKKETFTKLADRIRETLEHEAMDVQTLTEKISEYGLEDGSVVRVVEDLLDRGWLETGETGKLTWRETEK